MPTSDFGQQIGPALPSWTARPHPPRTSITGRFCRVEPLDAAAHAGDLFASVGSRRDGRWTYLPYGPFDTRDSFQQWVVDQSPNDDPLFHAIVDPAGHAIGVAAYVRIVRIDRANGVIEIGHWLAPGNFDEAGAQRQPLSAFMPPSTFRYDLGTGDQRD